MLFSVLVAAYNAEATLDRCVASILRQTVSDLELVLLDDGSADGTLSLCRAWAAQDTRVRVLSCPNGGVAAARNRLMQEARGEYIAPIDADDWVEEHYLQTLFQLCTQWEVPLAACNHWITGARMKKPCYAVNGKSWRMTAQEACHGALYHQEPDVSVWGKLYHRALFQGLHYPEGRLYEDTRLFAQVVVRAQAMAYTSEPLYYYWQAGSSICRAGYAPNRMDYLSAVDSMTEEIMRHFPEEEPGCLRRKAHAALSVRRYFLDAPPQAAQQKKQLDQRIASQRRALLRDRQAPLRDKAASLLLALGDPIFDAAWRGYTRWKKIK